MAMPKHSTRFMRPLTSNVQLYTAQMEKATINVYVADERVGSGIIEEITENSVKIGNERILARYVRLDM